MPRVLYRDEAQGDGPARRVGARGQRHDTTRAVHAAVRPPFGDVVSGRTMGKAGALGRARNTREFIDHVLELARPAGAVSARAMFGGHGIYVDARIVAIVVEDTLYLKTDAVSRAAFDERELEPFTYVARDGERVLTGYRRAPEEALESVDAMRDWLRVAQGAALRAVPRRPSKRSSRKPLTRRE